MDKEKAMQIAHNYLNDDEEMKHVDVEFYIREKHAVESKTLWVFDYGARYKISHAEEMILGKSNGIAVDKRTGSVEMVGEFDYSRRTAFLLHISRREFSPVRWILARVFMILELSWGFVTLLLEPLPSLPNFRKKSPK